MANFSVPTTGNAYTDVVGFLNNKISDLALMLDPATSSPTNVPTNSIRWSSAANRFEKWNGSAWNAASTLYAIAISGNAGTATTLQTARSINGTSFNGSADITTANWGTARTITIGATGKSVNGSAAVTWTLAELGISATMQPVVAAASLGAGQTAFGVPSTTGTGASGTWNISISGTAANCSRSVTASGLASGGGALTGDIAVVVPKADQALAEAGADDTTAMTPLRTAQAIAVQAPQPVVILASALISGGTAFDILNLPSTGYRCFRIVGRARQATMSAGGTMALRWSTDNGATFVSTNTYGYNRTTVDAELSATATVMQNSSTSMFAFASWGDYGNWISSFWFDLYVYPAETANDCNVVQSWFLMNKAIVSTQGPLTITGSCRDQNLGIPINALRIFTNSAGGSFTEGEYTVYGYKA